GARHAGGQTGAVARGREGGKILRRAVLRRELDRGLYRPRLPARAARSARGAAGPGASGARDGRVAGRGAQGSGGDAGPSRIPDRARRAAGGGAVSAPRDPPRRVVVAGDGHVGALAAIALRKALPGTDVVVIGTPP